MWQQLLALGVGLFLSIQASAQTQSTEQARLALTKRDIEVATTSLIQYAGQGDWVTVQLLLQSGVKAGGVEAVRGQTALHTAAAQGHERIVRELLQLGARADSVDLCGNTALINAAYAGHLSVSLLLLRNTDSDLNHKAQCGLTPLIAAVLGGNARVVRALLDAKADPRMPDAHGTTAVSVAKRKKREDLVVMLTSM